MSESSAALRAENQDLRAEIVRLQQRIKGLSAELDTTKSQTQARCHSCNCEVRPASVNSTKQDRPAFSWESDPHGLSKKEIERYSRQLILPCLGASGQARLKSASVLVVGAGGLGAPVLMYLAAAGVGHIGIVDKDAVAMSNLHRQVIHRESSVGAHKSLSAAAAVSAINSSVQVEVHVNGFTPTNAARLAAAHDIVVDASDNAATRYLVSDACCATGRPLVSGAALGTDGQLTVYHHGSDGPCYRCLFPVPPASETCSRCSDAGVLGPVPGFIGCLQALEAIKLLAGIGEPLSKRLLVVDGLSAKFTTVKLRPRSPTCEACGDHPTITASSIAAFDYQAFTGQPADDGAPAVALLSPEDRISAAALDEQLNAAAENDARAAPVLDVRPVEQFQMCHLPGSVNIPFDRLSQRLDEVERLVQDEDEAARLVVVCRRGNDSQEAVRMLKSKGVDAIDLIGGLNSCNLLPRNTFPCY